ncbi:hypothetical protein HPQ64_17820 [Rhizobiales bacterium]|uniref:hypothetical protein n=1 Tax=Hongsoonwoonella zoysiae TaxID=2821844 RepID=UPI0015601940|nr:hypothetical protein [Hongsoonwoonella zoysiae]NRG19553.1 hypothetical protein [Hongsoonwoonella zoysiae]
MAASGFVPLNASAFATTSDAAQARISANCGHSCRSNPPLPAADFLHRPFAMTIAWCREGAQYQRFGAWAAPMDREGGKKNAQHVAKADKEKRLAEALRANLRRRKAAKKPGSSDGGGATGNSADEEAVD